MPAPLPITPDCIRMAQQGIPPRDIAAHFNVSNERVWNLLSNARRSGHDIPRFHGGWVRDSRLSWCQVGLPPMARAALAAAAERRGLKVNDLAARLLEVIALDGMVDAVLDDGGADG